MTSIRSFALCHLATHTCHTTLSYETRDMQGPTANGEFRSGRTSSTVSRSPFLTLIGTDYKANYEIALRMLIADH
jgi:hypothetical protein